MYGIVLRSSQNNNVSENNIADNKEGIRLEYCSNNIFINNNITANNWHGITLWCSVDNKFWHNNFIDNTQHMYNYQDRYANIWDNCYPSGGNYWSGHPNIDTDEDGIIDVSYEIDTNNIDRFPLLGSFNAFDVGVWNGTACTVDVVSNSSISSFKVDVSQNTISFNVTGLEETVGFCRITIPNIIVQELWQGNCTILLNGEHWPFKKWTTTADTYVYLSYAHPENQITIIPELPSTAILLILMAISTLAIALPREKFKKTKYKLHSPIL